MNQTFLNRSPKSPVLPRLLPKALSRVLLRCCMALSATVVCLGAQQVVYPATALAADCSLGSILFKDTLYGLGTGIVVGGLVMIAQNSSTEIPAKLATAGLVGGGLGAIVGIIEISLSDCAGRRQAPQSGSSVPENKPEHFVVERFGPVFSMGEGKSFEWGLGFGAKVSLNH